MRAQAGRPSPPDAGRTLARMAASATARPGDKGRLRALMLSDGLTPEERELAELLGRRWGIG